MSAENIITPDFHAQPTASWKQEGSGVYSRPDHTGFNNKPRGQIVLSDTFKNPKVRAFDRVIAYPMWNQSFFTEPDYPNTSSLLGFVFQKFAA